MSTIRRSSVTVTLPASHQTERGSVCGEYLHGHQYTLTAWAELGMTDWHTVTGVLSEFRLRHLNDMIPAGAPTVDGLAGYLSERLAMHGIDEVQVHESDSGRAALVKRVPG